MRLQQTRHDFSDVFDISEFHTQHGNGVREVMSSIGNFGKKSVSWMIKNAADLSLLVRSGYDIYQGRDPTSALETLKKASKKIGKKEGDALLRLISNKKKEVQTASDPKQKSKAKKELKELKTVQEADKKEDLLSQIRAGTTLKKPKAPTKKPKVSKPVSLLDEIKSKPKLRKTSRASASASSGIKPKPTPNLKPTDNKLGSILEQIKARRGQMMPEAVDDEDGDFEGEGYKAKKNLLKLAKKSIKKSKKKQKGGKLSDVLGGISTVATSASANPVWAEVTLPVGIATGIASGIAKMFGRGAMKGSGCKCRFEGKGIKDELKKLLVASSKYLKEGRYKPVAKAIVKHMTGSTPENLIDKVMSKLQDKLKSYVK